MTDAPEPAEAAETASALEAAATKTAAVLEATAAETASALEAAAAETASALETAATEAVGLRMRDRVALYRETAEAATDTDVPFWAVLLLSGAIATLGLALNQTAVVIGAMLVAPLLGPLLGLALALAVGDGRLAAQTAATIGLGALGVVALAAGLTLALPFHDVTAEIAARTRPTLLDLAIAVASGLAGAVVTLSREKRLSSSIPGVAIAVALIPPLGVAGFGLGIGGAWDLVRGSLLLFGANLAGIVLSAMVAFLAVGMHRPDVVAAARAWHLEGRATGVAAAVGRARVTRRLRVFESTGLRLALVLAFAAGVAIPLSTSLAQIVREARVTDAVDAAAEALTADGRAFVLGQDVTFGQRRATVRLRLAATRWIGQAERARFEASASEAAGEPVALALEQVLASAGDLDALADAFPRRPAQDAPASVPVASVPVAPSPTPAVRLAAVLDDLAVPDSVTVLGGRLGSDGSVVVAYLAPRRLPPEAETTIARQAAADLGADAALARTEALSSRPQPLPADSSARRARLDAALATARRYTTLRLTVTLDSASVPAVRTRLGDAATVRPGTPARLAFSLR